MVCEKCEKKLGTVITPDTWKDGARNTTESGGRKLNENKALTSKKARFDPYGKNKFAICRICKSSVHQPGSHYCQGCAYKKACIPWLPLYVQIAVEPDYQPVSTCLGRGPCCLPSRVSHFHPGSLHSLALEQSLGSEPKNAGPQKGAYLCGTSYLRSIGK
ncbi:cysteine-rich PDZ-binding protein isoform X2 [Rhea pennata]|uniref:cysteine-rich PDZ-binding protein isoform X2 n=1 Tax=Rhea pennata TaxID=8795 RepID=UPI002E26278C